jgi:hypothetical protein
VKSELGIKPSIFSRTHSLIVFIFSPLFPVGFYYQLTEDDNKGYNYHR